MNTYRETLAATLDGIELDTARRREIERELIVAAAVAMMRAGFTIRMACEALGVPDSTVRTWVAKTPAMLAQLESARRETRAWLLGELRAQLEMGGKAASQAANVLAHLHFPELRERKVEQTITGGPDPDRARANLDAILGRGK